MARKDGSTLIQGKRKVAKYQPVETSMEAYEQFYGTRPSQRRRVFAALLDGPMTCEEIEGELGMRHQTVSPRIGELRDDGFIRKTGEKRQTSTGAWAFVWRVRRRHG